MNELFELLRNSYIEEVKIYDNGEWDSSMGCSGDGYYHLIDHIKEHQKSPIPNGATHVDNNGYYYKKEKEVIMVYYNPAEFWVKSEKGLDWLINNLKPIDKG